MMKASVRVDTAQLWSLLGLVKYYLKFVPHLANVIEPLCKLPHKGITFRWDEVSPRFCEVKKQLASGRRLSMFNPSLPVTVSTEGLWVRRGSTAAGRCSRLRIVVPWPLDGKCTR